MKKIITFLLSAALIMNYVNLAAQNPYCEWDSKHRAANITNITDLILNEREGCSFKFLLKDPTTAGWSAENSIIISVDGVDFDVLKLPWGTPYAEEIRVLPSGEIQFSWTGFFNPARHCFEIYNSLNERIFESPFPGLYEGVFLTYQNECIECIPITDFEGEYNSENKQVNLAWKAPESDDLIRFDIFRNDILIAHLPPSIVFYSDNTAELEDGDYKYCAVPVYPSECTFDEKCFKTYINIGVKNYKDNILVYPNPANNIVTISGIDVANVKIFNNIGQLLLNEYNTNEINASKLTNGIYILSIETLTGNTIQKKLIINH